MAEPETLRQYQLINYFNSDDSYAVIFEAGEFNALYKHDCKVFTKKIEDLQEMVKKGLAVEEGIKRLSEVYKDAN